MVLSLLYATRQSQAGVAWQKCSGKPWFGKTQTHAISDVWGFPLLLYMLLLFLV
jgi:hypothetical protein